jgi:FkbM family methyltransferase
MKNKIFIDCGAHCGESIIHAKKLFGNNTIVYSFEANTNIFKDVQKHFKDDKTVNLYNKAVWIEETIMKFYVSTSWSDGSSLYKEKTSGGINENIYLNVESIDLSSFLKQNFTEKDHVVLKLDVEGAEYEILNKLIDDGTINLVKEFYGEFHAEKIDSQRVKELEKKIDKYFKDNKIIFKNWELVNNQIFVSDRNQWKENLQIEPITFVIPTRNNLDFLKLAYKSIKELKGDHYVLILDDASEDGTDKWLEELDDQNVDVYSNKGPQRIGIVGMFDQGIKQAKTDIIFAFHADMVASPNLDVNILKYLKKNTVVCATRVEPPLHPPGPEKVTLPLGNDINDFNYNKAKDSLLALEKQNKDKTTNGIFAPWCMYKEDFLSTGGHDVLFAPQSKEDSDLFNRFLLKGFNLIQSWDGLVYHFTSRGSRFNKYSGGDVGKNSPEWLFTNEKNSKNFIRKWGTFVEHDLLMKPIITPKYDLCFILTNCSKKYLNLLEPYCSNLFVDCNYSEFLQEEQKNTIINLQNKFYSDESQIKNDIVVNINCEVLNDKMFNAIINLPKILNSNIKKECKFKILNEISVDVKKFKNIKVI